ncbi:MAG: hypothetical protein GX303_02605 [Clostridiales bacterium]|nr:hypothetical protein [Clostridiales bacterium]
MDYVLIVDVLLALFAVYGFYSVVREFARLALRRERFYVGLELTGTSDLSSIDGRIGAGVAMAGYDSHFECMPVILVSQDAVTSLQNADICQSLQDKGLRVFVEYK